jgi:hypothetical protein
MRVENNFNSSLLNSVRPGNKVQKAYDLKTSNQTEIINKEEKQFFANMFPEKKSEVMDYNFYNRSGKVNSTQVGSMFDRRF